MASPFLKTYDKARLLGDLQHTVSERSLSAVHGLQGLVRHLSTSALKVPLCHVPAGSGNGVAASCALWTPLHAALAIIKGITSAIDAATVVQPRSNTRRLAILSLHFGLLTDLDIGTENLRKLLGGERFTYGAIREIAKWRSHRARVAVCAGDDSTAPPDAGVSASMSKSTGDARCAYHDS
jgi:diacylglycerol kinase family enzyme